MNEKYASELEKIIAELKSQGLPIDRSSLSVLAALQASASRELLGESGSGKVLRDLEERERMLLGMAGYGMAAQLAEQAKWTSELDAMHKSSFSGNLFRDSIEIGVESLVSRLGGIPHQSVVSFDFATQIRKLQTEQSYLAAHTAISGAAGNLISALNAQGELTNAVAAIDFLSIYESAKDAFGHQLLDRVRGLQLETLFELDNPSPESIEDLDFDENENLGDSRVVLRSVGYLPLKVIAKILRSPESMRDLSPRQFEEFVAELLHELDFEDIVLTPQSRDGGKDVIASKRVNGIPLSFYFECKKYAHDNKVQLATLRALLGTMAHESTQVNKGVLVTTSTFTAGCKKLILSDARLDGKDFDGLLGWIAEVNERKQKSD